MNINEHYKLNYEVLKKKATRTLKDHALAEDVVQETYEKVIKYGDRMKHDNVDGWINVVFFNTCLKYLNFIRDKGIVYELREETHAEVPLSIDEYKLSAESILKDKSFSPLTREVLRLYIMFGYNSEEISEMLNISSGSVRSHIKRFKKRVVIDGLS